MSRSSSFTVLSLALFACQQEPTTPTNPPPSATPTSASAGSGTQATSPIGVTQQNAPRIRTEPGSSTAAGSGGSMSAPRAPASAATSGAPAAAGSAASATTCSDTYARASLLTIELRWPETLGLVGGTGQFVAWSKTTYAPQPDGTASVEAQPCGSYMPAVTGTEIAGGAKSAARIPFSVFDKPGFPRAMRTLPWTEGTPTTSVETTVLGARVSDPDGEWPQNHELTSFDDDADGAPGLTTIPLQGPEFRNPPTDISQLEFLDRLYVATRIRLEKTLTPSCSGDNQVAVVPLDLDYSVIGCHVQDRGECESEELEFIVAQRPRFQLVGTASWTDTEVALDASCETVRAALPMP